MQRAASFDDLGERLVDVTEQRDDLAVDPRDALRAGKALQRRRQRFEGDEEVEHLTNEEVDAPRRLIARVAEHVALDLPNVVLQTVDDRRVGLDGVQQGGLQHGAGPWCNTSGLLLQLGAYILERRRLAVANRHDVVVPT